MSLLKVDNVTKRFGGIVAIKDFTVDVDEGEVVGFIGPNGAGKTTLFNLISGIYKPDSGVVWLNGEDITPLKPYEICRKGISRTFQLVKPFLNLTVLQNTLVGVVFGRSERTDSAHAIESAMSVLNALGLEDKKDEIAGNLNIMQRKQVEIARAMATRPKLLLLDEPMAGLSEAEIGRFIKIIEGVLDSGVTVLLVEHLMKVIMNISDRIVVLNYGEKIGEGTPGEVASDRKVLEVYLE